MHKNQSSVINISVGTTVRIRGRSPEVDKSLIKTSHLSFYPAQIKNLEKVAQREGKAAAQVYKRGDKKVSK
jgi:hypothetical protein